MLDYRESHKDPAKGVAYHRRFAGNPYRAMMWDMEKGVLRKILATHFKGRAVRHLDFACGTARVLEYLQPTSNSSTGVDISKSMLDVARERLSACELIEADITRDDVLEGRTFDLITAFRFFPNAQESLRREVMECLVNHLSDEGILVFNNHKNRSSLVYKLGRLFRRNNLHEMADSEVQSMIAESGLRITDSYHMGVIPATERLRVFPAWLMAPFERLFSKIEILKSLSSNVIYVCDRPR